MCSRFWLSTMVSPLEPLQLRSYLYVPNPVLQCGKHATSSTHPMLHCFAPPKAPSPDSPKTHRSAWHWLTCYLEAYRKTRRTNVARLRYGLPHTRCRLKEWREAKSLLSTGVTVILQRAFRVFWSWSAMKRIVRVPSRDDCFVCGKEYNWTMLTSITSKLCA